MNPVALVSRQVQQELLDRHLPVESVVSNAAKPPTQDALDRVEIAFLSTDVVWSSVHPQPRADMQLFFEHLRGATNLRWLHVCSAGTNRPVFAELMARGVRVTTSSGANAAEVSQTALAGFLALARHVPEWVDAQRRRAWIPMSDQGPPRDITGQTAVVVGTGAIGREIARLLQALRLHVVGVNRTARPQPEFSDMCAFSALDDALCRADWLVLACPLTPETRGMINAARLRLMPPGARIINVARGEVIVETDMIRALQGGQLAGAYLDVAATEPLPADSDLWDLPSVLLSAHRAGFSTGVHAKTLALFIDNFQRWTTNATLLNEVPRTTVGSP